MNSIYFPSCNFAAASLAAAKKLEAYLSAQMPVAGCCRTDRREYPAGDRALYLCQACREVLEAREEFAGLVPENIFVWLDRRTDFSWPDYRGLTVSVQDCWRDREHPEIWTAVRSVLGKMGVEAREIGGNRERSVFCGSLHFEPERPENAARVAARPGQPLYQLPEEDQRALMAEQVQRHGGHLVLCYCNRCTAGIQLGGGRSVHLMELAMGTYEP